MARSIKLKNNDYIDSTGIVHNRELLSTVLNNQTDKLNKKLSNVCLHAGSGPTEFTVYGGPYATILVISMYYVGIIALNNGSQNLHNVYGNLPNLSFNWVNSRTIKISGFESWNHHIFVASNTIDQIVNE